MLDPRILGHMSKKAQQRLGSKLWNVFNVSVQKPLLKRTRETLTSLWSEKLHYKFIESTKDGDFMFALDAVKAVKDNGFTWLHVHKQTQPEGQQWRTALNNIQGH